MHRHVQPFRRPAKSPQVTDRALITGDDTTLPGSPAPPVSTVCRPLNVPQTQHFPGLPSTSGGPGGSVNTHVCILRCVLCSCCEAQCLLCGQGQKQGKPLFLPLLRVWPQSPAPGVRLHPLPTSKGSAFASRPLSATFFFPDASCSWNICVINYFSLDTWFEFFKNVLQT